MKKEFIVERQGRAFVLYAGLLDMAHQQGLKSIQTELIQVPKEENNRVAICTATVILEREGKEYIFTGIGDAAPNNVAHAMQSCLIRMAETRAKARALRDAVNVGVAAFEEITPDEEDAPVPEPVRAEPETANELVALLLAHGIELTRKQQAEIACVLLGYRPEKWNVTVWNAAAAKGIEAIRDAINTLFGRPDVPASISADTPVSAEAPPPPVLAVQEALESFAWTPEIIAETLGYPLQTAHEFFDKAGRFAWEDLSDREVDTLQKLKYANTAIKAISR